MSVISKSHNCPYRRSPHENLAFVNYDNGHWCYSCNKGEFKGNDYYVFKGINPKNTIALDESIIVPENFQSPKDFSLETLAWLYKYYIFDELIYKYSIRYCPYTSYTTKTGQLFEGESLLFPIISKLEIVAYQQRFFPNKQFYSKDIKKHIFVAGNHATSTVVLVEDFISAIRIGELENCIWLQGTGLTKDLSNYIIRHYHHIKLWLDGDEAGAKAAEGIYNSLIKRLEIETKDNAFAVRCSLTVRNITTENDPKSYSNEEIRRVLE